MTTVHLLKDYASRIGSTWCGWQGEYYGKDDGYFGFRTMRGEMFATTARFEVTCEKCCGVAARLARANGGTK